MRLAAALAGLAFATAAHAQVLGDEGARHLLNRVGFGATPAEIGEYAKLRREEAIGRIVSGARREASGKPPAFVDDPVLPFYKLRQMSDADKRARADFIVDTGGLITDTQAQIDAVLSQLDGRPETAFGRDWEA